MKSDGLASSLHGRLLTLDAHLDAPVHFSRPGWSFGDRHEHEHDIAQLDLPRLEDGNLSGGFFVVYTAQGPLTVEGYAQARAAALSRSGEIDATIERFSDRIGAARTAADAEQLHREGKVVAFKSLENCYPLGEDLATLGEFHGQGVRLAGPVHNFSNQFGDSATDRVLWNGLSALGREWVAEMNRLGILIDASHASDAAFDDMLSLSSTPVLLSHSGSRAIFDTPRNIDDGRLRRLAASGGAIGFTTIFLSEFHGGPERKALFGRLATISSLDAAGQARLAAEWRAMDAVAPIWDADLDRYMEALLHVIDVAGIDHVCFGADFDGGGGIPGLEDVTRLPRITERLQEAGLSDADVGKLWSGNLLRILRAAEAKATDSAALGALA